MSHCLADIFCLCQRLLLLVGVLFLGLAFSVPVHGQNHKLMMDTYDGCEREGKYINENSSYFLSLWLSHQPTADVTVTVTSNNPKVRLVNRDRSERDYSEPRLQITLTLTLQSWKRLWNLVYLETYDSDYEDEIVTFSATAAGGGYDNQTRTVTCKVADRTLLVVLSHGMLMGEGANGTFPVRLRGGPDQEVVVKVESLDPHLLTVDTNASIEGNQDTLTFSPANWYIYQAVTFKTTDDIGYQRDGRTTGTIRLTLPGGGYRDRDVTIVDNWRPLGITFSPHGLAIAEGGSGTFTMKLASQPAYNYSVVVTLTQPDNTDVTVDADPDTAGTQMSLIFTPSNWNQPQTVTVSAAEDDDAIFDRTNIRLTADGGPYSQLSQFMPVTVADDDAGLKVSSPSLTIAEGGSATFTVQLAAEPADDVTVTLAQSGTVNDDVSFDADENTDGNQTRLTFTVDNWNQDQTVTVNAAEDVDVADESVTIRLTASGGEYDAVSGSVSVNVTDDDVDLEVSPTALDVTEGASGTFTVQLASRPSDDVTVELVQSGTVNDDVTFDADGDTDGNQTRLTFTTENWGQGQTVTVSAAQDDDAVDDSATIKLSASGGGYRNITGSVEVEVEDNDTAKLVITADTDPLAVEEGKSAAFQVKLETRPSGEVTVELSRSGDTDVTVNPTSLTFTTDNWDDEQAVTVSAAEDDDILDENATINLTAAGGDYGGVTGSVSVTIDDTDEATLVITPAEPLKVKEEDSAPFRVKLAAQPSG
ncbi:MAG: BACON domain-containing protein, partial [Gammaproteobacteria bacterium AqS3]|nr:BACON domain-containing protein [Gammaproteobacteria bacterium AqS3]